MAKTVAPLRASILARISVDTEESDSVERQERDLRALAKRLGAEVVAIHHEAGVSGGSRNRPEFDAWLGDAVDGRANVLLAWAWDRISRLGLESAAQVVKVVEDTGARLVTHSDGMDSDNGPVFELMAGMVATMAKQERQRISARVSSRQAADRERGDWIKPAPFGYRVVNKRLVADPVTGPVLREMFTRYVDRGESLGQVADWLNKSGVRPPRAKTWGVSTVSHIVKNPASAGLLPHAGDVVRGEDGRPVKVSAKPVVSVATWQAACARGVARRLPPGPRPKGQRHPLSGKVRCAVCSGPMVYQSRAHQPGRSPSYRCVTRGCTGGSVLAEELLVEVAGTLLSFMRGFQPDSPVLAGIAMRLGLIERPASTAKQEQARLELAEVEASLAQMEDAYFSRRAFTGADGTARYERLHRDLTKQRDEFRKVAAGPAAKVNAAKVLDLDFWQTAPDDQMGRLFDAALDSVTVDRAKGTVRLDWRSAR